MAGKSVTLCFRLLAMNVSGGQENSDPNIASFNV
jgi:hypothetical protein